MHLFDQKNLVYFTAKSCVSQNVYKIDMFPACESVKKQMNKWPTIMQYVSIYYMMIHDSVTLISPGGIF